MDISALFLIVCLTRVSADSSQLEFLDKLMQAIQKENEIKTMLILQPLSPTKCDLQDWNNELPTLRYNELARSEIQRHFNRWAICLVCICQESDIGYLENVAEHFEGMRQARILLWVKINVTQEMTEQILRQITKHQFFQLIILEARDGEPVQIRRLEAFPTPHMVPFVNTTGEGVFLKGGGINFMGKRANVLPNWETPLKLYTPVSSNVSVPLQHVQDTEIILFAKKYNLSLEIMGSEEDKLGGPDDQTPDIRLTSELSTRTEDLTNLNPFDLYSLMVMVPCSRRRSVHEIFAQLNLQSWAQYILPVYVAFVAVETFILVVNQRIYGHAYHVSLLNPLMNLRAFRGILGLSFPTGRRTSPSLRQLFLSISVFGVVFSNYFSCKLSAVLTMNSPHPQVENFKDLRESGLPTVVSHITRDYITREVDINFFNRTIPNTLSVDKMDHVIMTLSLNDSYAYIISSENWNFIKNYQHAFNRKVFCISNDLVITHGVPKKYVLGNNSLFDWPLSKFLLKVQEAGIATHWIKESPYLIRNDLNLTVRPNREFGNVPISVVDLKWLWFVLGFGYGLSTLVFIIELSMRRRETKNKTPKTRQDDSLA